MEEEFEGDCGLFKGTIIPVLTWRDREIMKYPSEYLETQKRYH
jgi:hypothetical protein